LVELLKKYFVVYIDSKCRICGFGKEERGGRRGRTGGVLGSGWGLFYSGRGLEAIQSYLTSAPSRLDNK